MATREVEEPRGAEVVVEDVEEALPTGEEEETSLGEEEIRKAEAGATEDAVRAIAAEAEEIGHAVDSLISFAVVNQLSAEAEEMDIEPMQDLETECREEGAELNEDVEDINEEDKHI